MRYLLVLVVLLSGCGGYDGPEEEETSVGVTVTDNVPFVQETIQDIVDRGEEPPQGDREIPDHRITGAQ